ncbi:MAG: LPS export ABC transporter periplasmic protein LptC [Bacteroidales bacterium]|jgi:LPS export ABC transporter protein LptC|nr:LPS export ABC transporter periplasmic protein LptC [Bacteroidales bacterium]
MMLFAACKSKNNNSQLLEYDGKFPDESAENMTITVSDSGTTIFIVSTPILNRYNSSDTAFVDCPEGITITSFNDYGHKQAVITAGYACQINNNLFKATDNVVIYDLSNGDSVITDEVIWDQRQRSIYSTKSVKQVKSDGSINYGDGFNADERFTRYTIIHPHGEMVGYDF